MAAAGLTFDVESVNVDEQRFDGELPEIYVDRLAQLKASVAAARHATRAVIGADTVVVLDGDVMGKPVDAADSVRMLRRLGGRAHDVLTGLAVAWQGRMTSEVTRTRVWMNMLTEQDVANYVATGEPADKAGSYAIQGHGSRLISHIDGSFTNVVGLPVAALLQLLRRAGVVS